jgi:hypothetical protein
LSDMVSTRIEEKWFDVPSHMAREAAKETAAKEAAAKEAANALSLCSGGEKTPAQAVGELRLRNRRKRDREHKASVRERKRGCDDWRK